MDVADIANWLAEKQNYEPAKAIMVAKKILKCAPQLLAHFDNWMQTGVLPVIEVEGFTLERLIAEYQMKPAGAFLTLDWLIDEPETAKQALREGYDQIIYSSPKNVEQVQEGVKPAPKTDEQSKEESTP